MNRSLTLCVALFIASQVFAGEVYMTRFDPPRAYLLHPSINKGGPAAGLKGQDNFLTVYVPPVDNVKAYSPDRFTLSLLVPAYLEVLDVQERGLTVTAVTHQGQPYQQVTLKLDPAQMKVRCFDNTYGANEEFWYRVKEGATVPAEPQEISLSLLHGDTVCFTDTAKLRILDAIPPGPRVSPQHFKLWLHYGPHLRPGHWDELAQALRLAGINTIQCGVSPLPDAEEYIRQMRQRGFYIIIQRGASYENIYKDNMRACLEQGPLWFDEDDGGAMRRYLPLADAVLWDYEPSPMPDNLDPWLIAQFRQTQNFPADEVLDSDTIRAKYLRPYVSFRQRQLATCIKHWADYCRSLNPKIDTILTEGGANAFDPTHQVDYAEYQDFVTYCDPMNFSGAPSLGIVRQWMQHAPRAHFTGCQNVALSAYHPVFVNPPTIMMQTLSAALNGQQGTAVYPGPAMDADNFVLWARVMGFLGRHEKLMFEGRPDPANVKLSLLPKEEQEVTLGDGRKLRNTYPDWSQDSIQRSYAAPDGSEALVVLANWHAKELAYGKLSATLPAGQWLLLDDENKQVFTQGGRSPLPATALAQGVYVRCPAFDYRGWRLTRATPAASQATRNYQPVKLEELAKEAQAYAQTAAASNSAATGDQKLTFDDLDRDGKFEYLIQSPRQKVWVAQTGTIVRWTVGDQTLETDGLGLCRDMLWLPQGERSNAGLDMTMRLESKQVKPEGVTLVFSKEVPLATVGGASLRVTKELTFPAAPGEVAVRVRLANTSLAPQAAKLTCSYRPHNYLKFTAAGHNFWAGDGSSLKRWDQVDEHLSVPNVGLSDAESNQVFAQCDVTAPLKPVAFGDLQPDRQLLVKFTPAQPERLMQLLRWGNRPNLPDSGTVEWMYKPETLAMGKDLTYEYQISVHPNVTALDATLTRPEVPGADPHLLFHLPFDGTPDAAVARGGGQAEVTGSPTYEATANGQGIVITKGVKLSYLPAGNISLQRGRLAIRFKPLWEGADGNNHFLLTVRSPAGFVYLGKLDDGRFLMNMFGPKEDQHYGGYVMSQVRANTWHEAIVTWDIARGSMLLLFDGQKVGEYRGDPWPMSEPDNKLPDCRLTFPEAAEAVIDDVKIWDQP